MSFLRFARTTEKMQKKCLSDLPEAFAKLVKILRLVQTDFKNTIKKAEITLFT